VGVLHVACWFGTYICLHWRLDYPLLMSVTKTAFIKSRAALPTLRSHVKNALSLTVHGHFGDAPRSLPLTKLMLMFTGNNRRPFKSVKLLLISALCMSPGGDLWLGLIALACLNGWSYLLQGSTRLRGAGRLHSFVELSRACLTGAFLQPHSAQQTLLDNLEARDCLCHFSVT